jgi:hypothetical protein
VAIGTLAEAPGATTDCYMDGEPAADILERRWFAASAAVKSLHAECDVLLGVVELAEDAWRRTCAQVAHLEAIRDGLGERLAAMDEPRSIVRDAVMPREAVPRDAVPRDAVPREVMSAA